MNKVKRIIIFESSVHQITNLNSDECDRHLSMFLSFQPTMYIFPVNDGGSMTLPIENK